MVPSAKRKKILFLITKSNWGGAQRYVYDIATTLDLTTYEPVIVLGGNGELATKLTEAHISTITLDSLQRDISIKKEILFAWELWRLLRAEKPDVLHVNSSKAGGLGCMIGRLAGVQKVIFTAHGWAFNEDRPSWQKFVIKKLHWWTVILSHQTIAVSQAIVTQMNWPFAQRKMTVINPGRTIDQFAGKLDARQTIAKQHPPLAAHLADVWILTIGELHPIKQHDLLFKAVQTVIADHPNVRLVCIGDGELRAALTTYITHNSLQDNIFLTGPIHEAATLLKAADVFVLPSKSESYGYVLHEAGLARVPIIASQVGGITDIITNEALGTLVHTKTEQPIYDALIDFLHHPHTYQTKADALATSLQGRTVSQMVTKTVALYDTASSTAASST